MMLYIGGWVLENFLLRQQRRFLRVVGPVFLKSLPAS